LEHICAVKGSSVAIPCSFDYPVKERVQCVMWGHERNDIFSGPFIYDSELNTSLRFEYTGNKDHNCSFKIHQLEHSDAGKYTFRFITDSISGKWTGRRGSTLKIVNLTMIVTKPNEKETMKEGDSVNMTCVNSCDGDKHSSEFIWFKDGESIIEGPVLYLRNMSFTNSGNYTCSLKAHRGTTSGVIHIDVEYGPKNTSVSVKPSAKVDAGNNATLICSSHANPPVQKHTWYKIYDNNIIAIGHKFEHHFKEVSQGDDGQYFCRATNKHGSQNSSVVTLKVEAINLVRNHFRRQLTQNSHPNGTSVDHFVTIKGPPTALLETTGHLLPPPESDKGCKVSTGRKTTPLHNRICILHGDLLIPLPNTQNLLCRNEQ
uniref:B-cell receptor CD22 n=1 Tax=Acanthochromis polyacanthus TaxID=80966 RepID=A0A3Q1EBX6_9TELE